MSADITINIPLSSLCTVFQRLLNNRDRLDDKRISLSFFGTVQHLPSPPPQSLRDSLRKTAILTNNATIPVDDTNAPASKEEQARKALNEDFESGSPCAYIALILIVFLRSGGKLVHLDLSHCLLHELPMLQVFFNDPKIFCSDPDPLTSRYHTKKNYIPTWPMPVHWNRIYAQELFQQVAEEIKELILPFDWSIADIISTPNHHKTMVPIVRFPGFANLERLTLPYHAVIARPKTFVNALPTCSVPPTLTHITIDNAYPSRFLLHWMRKLRQDHYRLHQGLSFKVHFHDIFHTTQYTDFKIEVETFGREVGFGQDENGNHHIVMTIHLDET